ncbi:hypothetical protein NHF50_13890 [Flavobacterium sp. NRK F10]|uniref:Chromosome partitioning protein ParA n=1 Tax=Flavobacterium sediminis TaxID=2201181 RepID=A0A2U8QXQ2_9FLAO|nr:MULTISPECIES: hypothetical protein [Flavobacterium]AWM14888.1 hypothetical protein DI487_14175 [Flavobacterium sediminis]MCO6176139.1 hypothetical protein [Flavobacterium sp. NRK F10]
MENKPNNSKLKAVFLVLILLLIASVGYIVKLSSDISGLKKEKTEVLTEKDSIANDLEARIAELDVMSKEKNGLEDEIKDQKAEMEKLLEQVKKSEGDLSRYKNEYFRLKREMDNLVAENKLLKEQNVALTSSLDSTQTELNASKKYSDTLLMQNEGLAQTVEKGSKLAVLNLNVLAVKEKSSGKQVETDKASRANKLKVSFLIAENQIAKSEDKTYYVQIIDSKNNILGEKQTIPVGDKTLTYSFTTTVKYENKTVQVNEEVSGEDFQAGTYFVNVFTASGENVSKTSFNLR